MNQNQKMMTVSGLFFLASFSLIIFACTLKLLWLIIAVISLCAALILRSIWHVASPSGSFDGMFRMNQKPEEDAAEHQVQNDKPDHSQS